MRGTTHKAAICAALLGLGGSLVACDNSTMTTVDSGVDSGPMVEEDSGPVEEDAGPVEEDGGPVDTDAGPPDAGPPPTFLRLAHMVPDAPAMGVHLCLAASARPTMQLLITRNSASMPQAIPYRGVSNYVSSLTLLPIMYNVNVYDAADVSGDTCPAPTEAVTTLTIDAATAFTPGAYHTVLLTGRVADENLAIDVINDALAAPDTGMTSLRVIHAIPTAELAGVASVDVCFDPDGPGDMPATQLFDDIAFQEAADYLEGMPITAGLLSIHAHNADTTAVPDCVSLTRLMPIPVPVPGVPPPGSVPDVLPFNISPTFAADGIYTIFVAGDFTRAIVPGVACTMDSDCTMVGPPAPGGSTPTASPPGTVCGTGATRTCSNPQSPTIVPWRDDVTSTGASIWE